MTGILPAVPASLAFPGMSARQEWHLLIAQHMHLAHQRLTWPAHSTCDCQSRAIPAGMFSNNCRLPSCQGSPGSSWLRAPGLRKMQSTCVPPPPAAAAASPPPATESLRIGGSESSALQRTRQQYSRNRKVNTYGLL